MGFTVRPADGRLYIYGYNVDEVECGGVTWNDPPEREGKVMSISTSNRLRRTPECVSLPCVVRGGIYFRPNTNDPLSATQGLRKRLVHRRPPIARAVLDEFKEFVEAWLLDNLVPLTPDDIPTFEEWLEGVNHPDWRKDEYRTAYDQWVGGEVRRSKLKTKKCFVKREFYDAPKFQRVIHSPTDYEKVIQGRFIAAVEKKLFARPEFIKKIPRADWPSYIRGVAGKAGYRIFGSDYSSFEANFVAALQDVCELALARYMFSDVIQEEGVQDILEGNKRKSLESKLFTAYIKGRRSSGQMSTSLFNGFSNLLFNLFILLRKVGATEVSAVVEGDDGLFSHNAPRDPTPADYLQLGLTIKIVPVDAWYKASFCGVVTHPDVLDTLTNPWKTVLTCSWAGHAYLRARASTLVKLAQVKGLSYLAQYPGCPVVQSVALWMLRCTHFDPARLVDLLDWYSQQVGVTWWDRQIVREIRNSNLQARSVDERSRLIVEEAFGVSVETQRCLERLFDSDSSGDVALDPTQVPLGYREQWQNYVEERGRLDNDLNVFLFAPPPRYPQNLSPYRREDFDTGDPSFRHHVPV